MIDLLALIGFPKAKTYEFKAKIPFGGEKYYCTYVKRPGKRLWERIKIPGRAIMGFHEANTCFERWTANPKLFELDAANVKLPKVIIAKEDRNFNTMNEALE